jgi:hypothetical protein
VIGRRGPRKQHLLQIRYGNFYDDDGSMLVENWVSIVANKKKVIALDSNPSWTGKRPYILTTPLPDARQPVGPGDHLRSQATSSGFECDLQSDD